jgi:hypothetical protein
MALGALTSRITASGGGSLGPSSSFTAPVGDMLIAIVGSGRASSLPSAQTLSDSQGLTWVQAVNATHGGSAHARLQLWWAISNGNPMTVSVTAGAIAPDRAGLQVLSVSGAAQAISNTGSDGDPSGDPAPSLSAAPRADSIVIGAFIINDGGGTAPPSGFTEISDGRLGSGNDWVMQTVFDAAGAAQSAAWSEPNHEALAILVEIKARRPRFFATMVG